MVALERLTWMVLLLCTVIYASNAIKAVCVLRPGSSVDVDGTIELNQEDGGPTRVTGAITGLAPGEHGFHVHALGDYSKGCVSFSGHYNPAGKTHGSPTMEARHAGDLGNIVADAMGNADIDITDSQIPLMGDNSVVGRGIVVHELRDDLGQGGDAGSLKTGNAGSRLACCVIGLA